MVVQIIRGTRSEKYAAKDWTCEDCGNFNKMNNFLFFDLPSFYCGGCKKTYNEIIYFNLADIEVNGKSLLPEVKNQGKLPECAPYAYSHAQEFNDIVESIIMDDDSSIDLMNPMILTDTYNRMFPGKENFGFHKMLYTGLILKEYSRTTIKDKARSTRSDMAVVNLGKVENICQYIADGRAVIGTFAAGKGLQELKFGEVYSPPPISSKIICHAVLLIGAIIYLSEVIYIFLNSWGETFCALRDENGNIIVGGIGMVEGILACNPVVLSRSWEQVDNGQLSGSWRLDLPKGEGYSEDIACIDLPPKYLPEFTNKQINACASDSGTYDVQGFSVITDQSFGTPNATKDGVTVAKSIECSDRVKNVGASLVKQFANATNDTGTTCATTVLTKAIFNEGCKSIAAGVNAMDLRHGILMAVDTVVTNLKKMARMISTSEEIAQVGTVSANGEREIGELIAKAMEKVGEEGVITIADGNTLNHELEVVEGMKLDRGYISPCFVTNQKNQKCELNEPFILINDKKVSNACAMVKVMELALKKKKPLIIVAVDLESEALGTLILNKINAGVKVCAVKAPGFGETQKANLSDLAILTGAEVITEELGMNLENFEPWMFGTCKKVIISKDDTVFLDGAGDKKAIEERMGKLRLAIVQSTSDYDKEKIQERLAKLAGVAVLKIGGESEVEVAKNKDRVTNALNATKAAVEEGIVPGGGVALLYASKDLDKLHTANIDQKIGVQIIQNALKTPVQTIASNADVDGAVIVGKLLEQENTDLGYDAAKGEYVDMVKAGIIDPLKVIRTVLMDAASVSVSCLMTTAD